MNNIDEYNELIVCTGRDEIKIENSIEAVSNAICKYGIDGDISIYTADYRVLNTFGIYVERVTAMDASLILRYTVGLTNMNAQSVQAADVDGNGAENVMDAALILKKRLDLSTNSRLRTLTIQLLIQKRLWYTSHGCPIPRVWLKLLPS